MNLIVFAVVGKLLVWTIQTSGPTRRIWKQSELLAEFGECDFCVGCWVYSILAWLFGVNVLSPLTVFYPVLTAIMNGILVSFAVHLASVGWKAKWGYEVIEP